MVRMKRFYLMLCFLMSIIGSAWGQETVIYAVENENVAANANKTVDTEHVLLTFGDAEWVGKGISNADDNFKYTLDGAGVNALDADGNTIKTDNIKIPKTGEIYITR